MEVPVLQLRWQGSDIIFGGLAWLGSNEGEAARVEEGEYAQR
jgi:hypothetical protein